MKLNNGRDSLWRFQPKNLKPPPKWLIYLFATCLIIPKVNLIQITGQTSGIRIDDIFILLVTPYLLMQLGRYRVALHGLKIYLVFIFLALVSALLHIDTNGWKLVLYPVRLIEYIVFILAGAMCIDRNLLAKISVAIVLANTAAAIGQTFFDYGGFPYSRYVNSVEGRAIGLGAGPWEMAAIVNMAMASLYYAWNDKRQRHIHFFVVYLISLVGLILTESRVGLVVSTVTVAIFISQLGLPLSKRFYVFITVAALSAGIFFLVPNSLESRSTALMSKGNFDKALQIDTSKGKSSREAGGTLNFQVVDDGSQDPSWGVRAKKWVTATDIFLSDARNIPLGVGPGYFGPALDGGFVRVLVEHGSLGLLALLLALIGFDTAFRNYRVITMVFAAHMVFIDIYLSYKFISLLLFLLGAMLTLNNEKRSENATSN